MFTSKFFLAAVLATGAGLVSAAALPTLSAECQSTYEKLLTLPEAECLNLSALTKLALPGSVVPPLDEFMKGLCDVGACSNDNLRSLLQTAFTGCGAELQALGVTADTQSLISDLSVLIYPTARKLICLVSDSTGDLCVTDLLNGLQDITGTLSVSNVQNSNLTGVSTNINDITSGAATDGLQAFVGSLNNLTCSDCVKRGFNIVQQDLPQYSQYAVPVFQSMCGTSFTDGTDPAGISESAMAGTFVAAPKNSAMAIGSSKVMLSLLLAGFLALLL